MAATLIQQKSGSNTSTTALAIALTSNTTTGDFILVAINCDQTTDKISSVTATGMTFNKITAASGLIGGGAASYITFWYAFNITGATAPTITINKSATTGIEALVTHWSGLTTTDPLDQVSRHPGTTTAITSNATAALTQANELVIGVGASDFGGATYTAGSGYSNQIQKAASAGDISLQSKIVAATTAVTSTNTLSSTSDEVGVVMTFLINTGGGSVTGAMGSTEATDIMAASGTETLSGAFASTESNDVMNSGGAVDAVGTFATNESTDVMTVSGLQTMSGSLIATEDSDAMSGSGAEIFAGAVVSTEANDAMSSNGTLLITGTLGTIETSDVMASSGTQTISGLAAIVEAVDALAASGISTNGTSGTIGSTEANDAMNASGTSILNVTGVFGSTEADDGLTASGTGGIISGVVEWIIRARRRGIR